ncbi:hypothetical protein F511_04688 [Dorcoceras hygrometricum]|uniref:Dystroglycan-like n=1 Tax=Dorcoceras hygrometricum TaxID=472368 RepID=A0A2Z7AZH5_9LAMI|nr:hypothetical protein F511_04688 [Dorcoceras hygrometricum]
MVPTTTRHTIQSQLPDATSSRKLSSRKLSTKAGIILKTGTRRNTRNAAFQLNHTTSRCSLDWFLKSTAGHPVATLKSKNDRKVLMAEESTKSWADTDSDSSSSSSSSSDSEQEEVHCLMADQTSEDKVFDFSNVEFTREDLFSALNDMVKEYRKLSHTFDEVKDENDDLKNSSVEPSIVELGEADSLKIELSKLKAENELLRSKSCELDESSSRETSNQSQLVYEKFNKMSFVKASVTYDNCESMTYNDQTSQKLNHKGKAGIGYQRPDNSKPSWLKNKLDKDKAKAGSKSFAPNQPRRNSTEVKSSWRKVQPKRDLSGQNMKSTLNRSHHNYAQTLTDSSTGKIVKAYSQSIYKYAMASSLFVNIVHIFFESVLAMDNAGMLAVFESLVATGLKGFLGCPAVIHEIALLEFFENGSVRDGLVVSTVNGVTVEISEQLLAETFELPVECLIDLSEIPKDIVFDARSIVSLSGEPVSTSGKKREMKIEFRLLCDILAKTISVKTGSFDAITQEKFLVMAVITCGVRINWNRLLFNILKDMVTPGSRQAKGYAIQISLLLENVPNLELGESSEFPSSKILTEKTVNRYMSLNDKVGGEEVADVPRVKRTPVKKAVSKKRPAVATVAEPVKKKRTTKSKSGSSKDKLEILPVAQEAVPLQIIESTSAAPTEQPTSTPKQNPEDEKKVDDIRSFVSTIALDRSVLRDVQLVQSSVFVSPHVQFIASSAVEDQNVQLPLDQRPHSPSTTADSSMHFVEDDIQLEDDSAPDQFISTSSATAISVSIAALRESFSNLVANQSRYSWKTNNALSELMCKISHVERVFLDNLAEQNETFRGLFKRSCQEAQNDNNALSLALKAVRTQNVILSTDLEATRKEVKDLKAALSKDFDDKLADIRNELLEFRVETHGQLASLGTHLAELIAFLTKGSDDKKREDSSSRHRQPPPDDQSRPSGGGGGTGNGADEQSRPVGSGTRESDGGSGSQRRGDSSGSSKRRRSSGESPVRGIRYGPYPPGAPPKRSAKYWMTG